jgi:integrase
VIRLSGRCDPATGKRVREVRTVRGTRRDAERALAALVRERAAHGPTPTTSGTLTIDAWVRQHLTTADLSDRTRRDQADLWARYSTPALRARPLRDVTTAALDAHMGGLRQRVSGHTGRPLTPRTRQLFFNVVRAALQAAVRTRLLLANPATGVVVKGGSGVSRAGQALTPDEMARFLAHDPEDRLFPLWVTAAHTGCRPGELLALWWNDLDAEAATLTVQRAVTDGPDGAVFAGCKAGSARVLPVSPELLTTLQRHRKQQVEERLRLGDRWVDPRLIFASEIGTVLDRHNVATRFRARCKAAGVRPVRWYDMRHSVGSTLIATGVDPKTVSQLLGHRDVATTLRHYVHPDQGQHRAAIAKLPWAGTSVG